MKPTMVSYLSSLTLGEEVLFKCGGQIYQERVERATVDFIWVDKIRFNRHTGTESPMEDDEELSLEDCAILIYPSPEAIDTYRSHKKRRMTSAHIKALAATGLLHELDDNCRDFLQRCYKIFDEKLAEEEKRKSLSEAAVCSKDMGELVAFVQWGIEQDMIEECSVGHSEFVKRVLDEKAALKYVDLVSQEQVGRKA